MYLSIFVGVLMALSVQLAQGQTPTPCDPPAQMSFRALQHDHQYMHINRIRGMYDANNRRIALVEDMTRSMPGKQFFHFIYLFAEGVAYEINVSTKKCYKGPSGKFPLWGIPLNSTLEDVYTLGGPGESFEVVEWSDRLITRSATWVGMYTRQNCYPVNIYLYQTENFNNSLSTNVFDVNEGLIDPSDFIPPAECQQEATMSSVPLSDHGKLYLNAFHHRKTTP